MWKKKKPHTPTGCGLQLNSCCHFLFVVHNKRKRIPNKQVVLFFFFTPGIYFAIQGHQKNDCYTFNCCSALIIKLACSFLALQLGLCLI